MKETKRDDISLSPDFSPFQGLLDQKTSEKSKFRGFPIKKKELSKELYEFKLALKPVISFLMAQKESQIVFLELSNRQTSS